MWPAVLLSSSATGLALGLARLKVLAFIPATIILSLTAAIGGIVYGMGHHRPGRDCHRNSIAILLSHWGLLSEAPSPRATPRTDLRHDLIRAAQFAIGEELRTQFQTPRELPRQLRTRMEQLAVRYG
jgi:hypothetical protein